MSKAKRFELINLRKSKNLTQTEVAKALNITTSYYGMIELGVRNPSLILANNIALYFQKKVDEIFFENRNNNMLCEKLDTA